jgi:hypothetical protein
LPGLESAARAPELMSNLLAYKSSGRKPVRFAIRANILGPISSRSWNANT